MASQDLREQFSYAQLHTAAPVQELLRRCAGRADDIVDSCVLAEEAFEHVTVDHPPGDGLIALEEQARQLRERIESEIERWEGR